MRILLVFLLVIIYPAARAVPFSGNEDTSKSGCMQLATQQLEEALSLMQKHYYRKDVVKWESIITAAKERMINCGSCADAYETVNWCFRQMNEKHSFVMPAASAAIYTNDTNHLLSTPPLSRLVGEIRGEHSGDRSVAYLAIPWVNTSDLEICTRIGDSIQSVIAALDKEGVQKWIIDLRNNTGGNCWPMIAGIGPLLGEGVCGYFVSGDARLPIIYKNGAAMQGKYIRCQVSEPYQMKFEKKFIIVLTGPKTSSSGEIVALAFKGKEDAYLYGQPTAGFTTANATYSLSDKSLLVLTVCMEADRTGKVLEGRILPDKFIAPDKRYDYEDPAKAEALMWLQMQ